MKLDNIFKICKSKRRFVVFRQNPKTQWLGDGTATYAITNSTKLTPEFLTASASLKPQEVEITCFKNVDFPEKFDATDNTGDENIVAMSDVTISFPNGEYTPVFTTEGIRFIKTDYLKPFDKDEYEIFERHTEEDAMYFVVKVGMFVNAIILAQDSYLDIATVAHFQKIAEKMQYARSVMEQKGEEVNSLDED